MNNTAKPTKIIITLDLLPDTDAGIIRGEFERDILPDYTDCVSNMSVRVEGGDIENEKEKK